MAQDVFSESRSLAKRLESIDATAEEERKVSPQQIEERRVSKRLAAIAKASPEARAMAVTAGKLTEAEVKRATTPEKPPDKPAETEAEGARQKAR